MATPGYAGSMAPSHPAPPYHPTPGMQPMTPQSVVEQSPTKEVNTAAICHLGQETMNDLVYRTYELFQIIKTIQLPNGVNSNMDVFQEKRNKVNITTESIRSLFQKLRAYYNRVLLDTAGLEPHNKDSLVPYEGVDFDDSAKSTDIYKYMDNERRDLVEQIRQKNGQLKEIIDQLRSLVWEINTMITMRKS